MLFKKKEKIFDSVDFYANEGLFNYGMKLKNYLKKLRSQNIEIVISKNHIATVKKKIEERLKELDMEIDFDLKLHKITVLYIEADNKAYIKKVWRITVPPSKIVLTIDEGLYEDIPDVKIWDEKILDILRLTDKKLTDKARKFALKVLHMGEYGFDYCQICKEETPHIKVRDVCFFCFRGSFYEKICLKCLRDKVEMEGKKWITM